MMRLLQRIQVLSMLSPMASAWCTPATTLATSTSTSATTTLPHSPFHAPFLSRSTTTIQLYNSYDQDPASRRRSLPRNNPDTREKYYWEEPSDVPSSSSSARYDNEYDDDDNEYEYDEYYDDDNDAFDSTPRSIQDWNALEWEACSSDVGTAHVLMPPQSVDRPTAVVHFVGGTLFGSAPSLWYHAFLQDVVRNTNAAVVATSIPVTLSLTTSPLQHEELAQKLERQFRIAWRDVLEDEYGAHVMKSIPVCGMGHSLGARLLVVSATRYRKPQSQVPPSFKALMLISFTNYGAAAGIPGLWQLNKASRKLERDQEVQRGQTTRQGREEQMSRSTSSSRRRQRQRRRRRSYDNSGYYYQNDNEDDDDDNDYYYWNDYDQDEEDWGEIFADLGDALKQQATKIKSALTPASESLEFYPSPDDLWKALTIDKCYNVSNTLLVQFDDDEVDQSAKLATTLQANNSTQVYFSRIRGTHLSPVMPSSPSSSRKGKTNWLERFNSRLGRSLAKVLTGRKRARQNEESLLQLRQAISSYIIEMVAKD